MTPPCRSTAWSPASAAAWPALLVVLVLGQGQGQEGGQLHRPFQKSWSRKRAARVDGVICGHIHHAAIENMDGIEYINTGDWVESCTAVVEHFDGRMEIIRWTELAAKP